MLDKNVVVESGAVVEAALVGESTVIGTNVKVGFSAVVGKVCEPSDRRKVSGVHRDPNSTFLPVLPHFPRNFTSSWS